MRAYWAKLSARERRLFYGTGGMLALSLCFLIGYRGQQNIRSLDQRIAQLEQDLVNLREQDAQSSSAEKAFRAMSAQHSSAWSKEEIEDRLRQEVYRLALKDLDKKDPKQADYMVSIPNLRAGTLHEDEDEGYREYQLALRIDPAGPMNVMSFIERLQKSNQSLRIDGLELGRQPSGTPVHAFIDLTRTVLNSDPDAAPDESQDAAVLLADGGFELWDDEDAPPGWSADGCRMTRNLEFATEGKGCLEAVATSDGGAVYAKSMLQTGRSYRLSFDVTSEAPVLLGVREPGAADAFTQARQIEGGGNTYRCELLFTPASGANETEVWAPYVELSESGQPVYLDNVQLTPYGD